MSELKLRDFQQTFIDNYADVRAVLNGDDMGLGKTVQAVVRDQRLREKTDIQAKTLVVCPMGMIKGWAEHFRLWAPELKVFPINNKDREPFMMALETGLYDVYIMHWPVIRLMPELAKYPWYHVIADEAHSLQNRKAAQTQAMKQIKSYYKTALTGTPVYNKPDDLWSILNWLYPKFWPSYWNYYNRYINWVDWNGYKTVIGVKNEEELREQMKHFYVRRRKEEVLKDLPSKYYDKITVQLGAKQRRAYDSMKKEMIAWVGEHEDEPINAPVVIAQLMRLQQFAIAYPAEIWQDDNGTHVTLGDPSAKLDALTEVIKATDQPVVVFSQFSQVINLLGKRLEKAGISHGLYTGSVSKSDRDQLVEEFQANKLRVFAGTIKAGGVGLTLTAASIVSFIDRDWAQSLNIQAEDRLHRIGQQNAVQVIDFVAEDTIDSERLDGIAMSWSVVKQLLGEL